MPQEHYPVIGFIICSSSTARGLAILRLLVVTAVASFLDQERCLMTSVPLLKSGVHQP